MKLYCNTNKLKKKHEIVNVPRIKFVEACLFLREPKYRGVITAPTAPAATTPPRVAANTPAAEPTGNSTPMRAGNTAGTVAASPSVRESVYSRPVGVKKMKKMQAIEESVERKTS